LKIKNKSGARYISYCMRRSFVISNWFYRCSHILRRNRAAIAVYALMCSVFIVVGVAVGINVDDKAAYVVKNGSAIFVYLRGDGGTIKFFFADVAVMAFYAALSSSMFFSRYALVLTFAPIIYKSYTVGMHTCMIVTVFTAASLPMLFVFFVPINLLQLAALCVLSRKCISFTALNGRCFPSKPDIIVYYRSCAPFYIAAALCSLVKAVTVSIFGSALIGIV
jgi:hypothetical protein